MPMTACSLGKDIIHSVTNPLGKLTGALHVYGGDFLKQEREEWDDETLRARARTTWQKPAGCLRI